MEDANIFIKNGMGSGKNTIAQQKLSAKHSLNRNKSTMQLSSKVKNVLGGAGKMAGNINTGSSTSVISKVGKLGATAAIGGALVTLAIKGANFGINYKEAETGNSLRAHNSRAIINMISTAGTNVLYAGLKNEIFTKKIISRQNFSNDYGRELYNMNVEGQKTKRI